MRKNLYEIIIDKSYLLFEDNKLFLVFNNEKIPNLKYRIYKTNKSKFKNGKNFDIKYYMKNSLFIIKFYIEDELFIASFKKDFDSNMLTLCI